MTVSIEQVFNVPGSLQEFDGSLNLTHIKRHGEALFPELLAASGTVANRAGVVTLRYQISGRLPFTCDRCLMQSELMLSKEFVHTVVRSLEDEELEDVYLVCGDGTIKMDEVVSADLLLWIPAQLLCREDCKGLCSDCGANQNLGDCGCRNKAVDPRLSKLKELLD